MNLLRTFLQLSDLHFGRIDSRTGDSDDYSLALKLEWLDGLLGHSYDALTKIEDLYCSLRDEQLGLIFTGDLTRVGAEDEYAAGRSFMGSDLPPTRGKSLGLGLSDWIKLAVPGNHDHWPGKPLIGSPLPCLSETYRPMPFVEEPILLPTGHRLQFLGIDTDADVCPYGLQRIFARGAFLSQLKQLETLPAPSDGLIRVLIMHHSGALVNQLSCCMAQSSRSALLDLASAKGITMMLCGHTHVARIAVIPLSSGVSLVESCCGASARRTVLPMDVTVLGQRPVNRRLIPNSVILHQLFEEHGAIIWETKVLVESCRGFVVPKASHSALFRRLVFPRVAPMAFYSCS